MLVNKFEKQPREFYERTSKHLDKPLKRSVLIAILDPDTKLTSSIRFSESIRR